MKSQEVMAHNNRSRGACWPVRDRAGKVVAPQAPLALTLVATRGRIIDCITRRNLLDYT